jgi:hypothetical protein
MFRLKQNCLILLDWALLIICTSLNAWSQGGNVSSPQTAVRADAGVISLIERCYHDEGARKDLIALPKSKIQEQLIIALQSDNADIVHNATTLLRDQYGSSRVCGPIRQLLAKLLADPKDKTLSTRMVCCEILRRYPQPESMPILIKALDDPGMHHSMAPAPRGVEHIYRSVWQESLRALKAIGGESVSSYSSGSSNPWSSKDKWILEAKTWWKNRNESSNNPDAGDGK